jgi:hypothetical protein
MAVRPAARIEAFISGRRAEVVSAILSNVEVGAAEVRLRIPEIRADDHMLVIRIAGAESSPAALRIAR